MGRCQSTRRALATLAIVLGAGPAMAGGAISALQQPRQQQSYGLFRLGPVYLTPTLTVGQVGIDSNVFYTASDRQADFVADGGPGLEARVPMGSSVLLGADGGLSFLYFARTESQRKTTGRARVFLDLEGSRTRALVSASRDELFHRPRFEVDDRISELHRQARAELSRAVGRLELTGGFSASQIEVEEGQEFRGADLARSLNRDVYRAVGAIALRITPKTSFLVEGDHQIDRFASQAPDLTSNRLGAGFEVESQTRLAGRVVAGARRFRREGAPGQSWFPYVSANVRYAFGPRTAVGIAAERDQAVSAFETAGATPTSKQATYRAVLGRRLWGQMDLQLFGELRQLESDGAVQFVGDDGEVVSGIRRDDEWSGGANLGYRFRESFRIGIEARYADRDSTFGDLGVDGLLIGFTVVYSPGNLIDLIAR